MAKLSDVGYELHVLGQPRLKVARVSQRAGGKQLDSAELYLDLPPGADPLANLRLGAQPAGWLGTHCQIYIDTPNGRTFLHAGDITQSRPKIEARDDGYAWHFTSSLEPYHFGVPLVGMRVRNRTTGAVPIGNRRIDGDYVVFNPSVDGRIIGNKSRFTRNVGRGSYPLFRDTEASRTNAALQWSGEGLSTGSRMWTLAEACLYCMWECNPQETFVQNWQGTLNQLAQRLDFVLLHNHRVKTGVYLPEALDSLLDPLGFAWNVEYVGPGNRRLNFYKRGHTPVLRNAVLLQPAGSVLDPAKSNLESLDLNYDNARNLYNRIDIYGDCEEVEITIELQKGWDAQYDSLTFGELVIGSDTWKTAPPAHHDVGRKWVVNEAGDYIGTRPQITAPTRLDLYFFDTRVAVRRRRFEPCITLAPDGTPAGESHYGVRLEWDRGDGRWEIYEHGFELLDNELGIRLTTPEIPTPLRNAEAEVKFRITATIRSDERITRRANAGQNMNPRIVPLVVQATERFHLRTVHSSSVFFADVQAGTRKSAEVDDRQRMQDYADQLVDAWNRADCGGRLVITGLDWPFLQLGHSIDAVQGRNIDFRVHASEPRYPDIVGIDYDALNQQTTLTLDTHHHERQRLAQAAEKRA